MARKLLKSQIKITLSKVSIGEDSFLFFPYRVFARKIRKMRILEKFSDLFGIFSSQMVSENQLKHLWQYLIPHDNGYELVRIGGDSDGGYLLPNDFDGISHCFSPGAGAIWTFEEHLGNQFGITSFVCDGTIAAYPNFAALEEFIPKNVGLVGTETVISLDEWILRNEDLESDLILQMDIEGGEYPILSSLDPKMLDRFRIIVLELHDLHLLALESSFSYQYEMLMKNLISRFDIIHLHPNACGGSYIAHGEIFPKVVEITLHRKGRGKLNGFASVPNTLDCPNDPAIGEFSNFNFLEWAKC